PRLIIPWSAVLTALFDFLMAFVIFVTICIWYKQGMNISALVYFPSGILMTVLAACGAGTLLSALVVKYRDFRYVVPFLLQVTFFSAQVIYPLEALPSNLKLLLSLNPLNGSIELFRAPLINQSPDWNVVFIGMIVTILLA